MRRVHGRRIAGACVLIAALSAAAASADSLRCGNRVISRGDHAAKVLRFCGEPTAVRSWVVQRGVVAFGSIYRPGLGLVEDVVVEEWTYNFGPRKLMRQLRLENGLLREVEQLGYGYRRRRKR